LHPGRRKKGHTGEGLGVTFAGKVKGGGGGKEKEKGKKERK